MFDLTGKKVVITGSTQGIGFAIAKTMAESGAKVFICGAHDKKKCDAAASKIPGAVPVIADLADENCAKKIFAQTGEADILVLNASIQYRKKWNEITPEEFDKQVRVNLKASLELIKQYAEPMKEKKYGRILTIGSIQQYKPHPDMAVYAATKAAQMNLVMNLAKQLAPFGININNLSPGVIETPRNEGALKDENYRRNLEESIPCGISGRPDDCAGAALLLCSDEGRYITGIDLIVDGGMHL